MEDKDNGLNVAQIAKATVQAWKDVDLSQIQIKGMSGLGGNQTYKVRVSDASANIAPVAVAFDSRDESNKELLEERNSAAGSG